MMSETKYRPLNILERNLIDRLLKEQFPGRDVLKKQADSLSAKSTEDSDSYGSIYLTTELKDRADSNRRVPVEARFTDSDGMEVLILLHVVDGYLNELEIVKMDGSKLLTEIDPSKIEVLTNV